MYKCREPSCGNQTRQLLLKNRCNVNGCKGRVNATISEAQTNDTLRYLQGLFNVDKFQNELALTSKKGNEKENAKLMNVPHKDMLDHVMKYIDTLLESSKYNKVDLSSIFSFMNTVSAV